MIIQDHAAFFHIIRNKNWSNPVFGKKGFSIWASAYHLMGYNWVNNNYSYLKLLIFYIYLSKLPIRDVIILLNYIIHRMYIMPCSEIRILF